MIVRAIKTLTLAALMCVLTVGVAAQDPVKTVPTDKDEAAIEQVRLKEQFQNFQTALLQVAQRLERSARPEDRERAVILKDAIKKASELETGNKFDTLVSILRSNKTLSLTEAKEAMERSKMVAEDIRSILAILMSDNRDAQLKAEREHLQKMIKMLDKQIREQKVVRAQTEAGKNDKDSLSKSQDKVTKGTQDVAKAMGKESDPKSGQQGKGDDKKDSKGKQGNDKQGSDKQGGEKKGGEPKDGQNQQNDKKEDQPPNSLPGKKQIQDAVTDQQNAKKRIDEEKRDQASKEQDEAIKKLEEVRKKWEELLRQLREEEMERLLAALQLRCERMLAMQIEVYEGTVRVEKAIEQGSDEKKPSRQEEQRSLQLSDREQEIVRQANAAIQLLEADGSAVAFPEVFQQIRDDMLHVARRLGKVDVANVTQTIEQDIIATLKEMIEALKKAQQDLQNKKQKDNQGGGNQGNQNLIDMLAELKMIRSLQLQVNRRTVTYAAQYKGEQANQPDIRTELSNLAQRQQKIFQITNDIARGKNR